MPTVGGQIIKKKWLHSSAKNLTKKFYYFFFNFWFFDLTTSNLGICYNSFWYDTLFFRIFFNIIIFVKSKFIYANFLTQTNLIWSKIFPTYGRKIINRKNNVELAQINDNENILRASNPCSDSCQKSCFSKKHEIIKIESIIMSF